MSPEALFLSSKNGAACMYPTQDSALGMWALTFFSPSCPPLVLDRAFVEDLLFVAYPKRRSTVVARASRLQRQWDEYSAAHRDNLEVCVMNHVANLAPHTALRAPFVYTGYGLLSMLMPQVLFFILLAPVLVFRCERPCPLSLRTCVSPARTAACRCRRASW